MKEDVLRLSQNSNLCPSHKVNVGCSLAQVAQSQIDANKMKHGFEAVWSAGICLDSSMLLKRCSGAA
jgi:hypothetical protein